MMVLAIFLLYLAAYGCKPVVNYLAFYPDTKHVLSTDSLPRDVEEFFVTTDDKVRIHNLFLPSEGSERVLIYFHGNAGNIYHRIPDLNSIRVLGLNVIGVSYRGYGRSEGSPGELGLYRDGEAVYRYVTEELGFAEENIILFGRSIGSTVAVNIAQHKSIAALVLVTPLTSAREQARAGGLGIFSSLAGDAFDNLGRINNVKAPLLIVHGTGDRIIPFAMGQALFDSYKGRKKLTRISGAGHNDIQYRFSKQYWQAISDFVAELKS